MSSMDYCKFENTLKDLRRCFHDLIERDSNIKGKDADGNVLSNSEMQAAEELCDLCMEFDIMETELEPREGK